MNYLALLKGLVTLVTSIAQYMRDKKLIDAGVAQAVLEGLEDANKAIADIKHAQSDDSVRVATRKKYTKD